ncbi:MAG: 16S rRNA processing protein RimM, partial [Pseudomonadota bacterium]
MARNKELIVVGVITGAHGVRGDVRVKSFTAEPEALFDYAPFFDKAGEILLTPKAVRSAKDSFVVSPEIPRQKEGWDRLKGTTLHVPRHILPHP